MILKINLLLNFRRILFFSLSYAVIHCKSNLNCNFDNLSNFRDSGFCEWRPNFEGFIIIKFFLN